MVRYKTIEQFARESGYTPDAIRTKIRDGIWPKHQVWKKAPDGRVLIDVEGYYTWVEMGEASGRLLKVVSKSHSSTRASAAASASISSPPPLT
ncbi:excisionase [Ectopseudomonas mendocina]|nr:excisionase [Pseudomonas mendocina]